MAYTSNFALDYRSPYFHDVSSSMAQVGYLPRTGTMYILYPSPSPCAHLWPRIDKSFLVTECGYFDSHTGRK